MHRLSRVLVLRVLTEILIRVDVADLFAAGESHRHSVASITKGPLVLMVPANVPAGELQLHHFSFDGRNLHASATTPVWDVDGLKVGKSGWMMGA